MLPVNPGGGPAGALGFSAPMLPQERSNAPKAAGEIASNQNSTDDDYLFRRRIQKLRWLGLDHEADRLAAKAQAEFHTLHAHLAAESPETD